MTRLTLAFILAAFPALAEDPDWNGDDPVDPPTEEPAPTPEPPTVTTLTPDGDSEHTPHARIYFGQCLCDGRYTVAWGFETYEFRKQAAEAQCRTLNVKRRCEITDQEYVPGVLK